MTYSYTAIEVIQRTHEDAPRLLLFSAPAGDIAQWADVERLEIGGEGHQRRRNESKIRAIERFLEVDPRNTIPSALTIALWDTSLSDGVNGCRTLTIPDSSESKSGLIIDGQHRLYGAERHNKDTLLNVVGILDPTDLEIAFQFLVINNKASRVPTDHIRLLSINIDDRELTDRLKTARMSLSKTTALVGIVDSEKGSPFYKSVIWPVDTEVDDERVDYVRPAAIEVALSIISQKGLIGLDNDDALISFFFALWSGMRRQWPELWAEESRLLSKAGLVAMTIFLLDDLTPLTDRGLLDAANPDEVLEEVVKIVDDIEKEFWTSDWTMTGLDTPAGRQVIVDSLQRARRNRRLKEPWYSGISLVSTSAFGADIS